MALYQATIQLAHPIRDARAIHRAISHRTYPDRVLWSQPAPRTLIVRTPRDTTWHDFPHATTVSTSLARTDYATGQPVQWALVANPTRCVSVGVVGQRPRGRHTGITDRAEAEQWARKRLTPALSPTGIRAERVPSAHSPDGLHLTRWAFAGAGTVTDPGALARLLTEGVGRGKAFGCGMLLIAEQQPRVAAA